MNPICEPTRIPATANQGDSDSCQVVARAMASARLAQAQWSRTPLAHRLKAVRKLRRLIAEDALRLADASAVERQRSALESLTAEVLPLAEACRFLERNAQELLAPKQLGRRSRPLWLAGVSSEIYREPLGVVL